MKSNLPANDARHHLDASTLPTPSGRDTMHRADQILTQAYRQVGSVMDIKPIRTSPK